MVCDFDKLPEMGQTVSNITRSLNAHISIIYEVLVQRVGFSLPLLRRLEITAQKQNMVRAHLNVCVLACVFVCVPL